MVAPESSASEHPLIVIVGPTASGKTSLALHLAQQFHGEIVSCDSVAVYRDMEIGTAKPSAAERALVPHHLLDVFAPDQTCTAGDYSRLARIALAEITARGRLPIVAGGTGLYLRALIDGLFPAPQQDPALRERLRSRAAALGPDKGPAHLHRILQRLDPAAASLIHPNDVPKTIRAIEVSLHPSGPITAQWQQGREALTGYRILRLGLAPPRTALYKRINERAAAMFEPGLDGGLIAETRALIARYGANCRPLTSLGYAEACAVLRGEATLPEAIAQAQQGHRNYAKRQGTWFRRERDLHWLAGFGFDSEVVAEASGMVAQHLRVLQSSPDALARDSEETA